VCAKPESDILSLAFEAEYRDRFAAWRKRLYIASPPPIYTDPHHPAALPKCARRKEREREREREKERAE